MADKSPHSKIVSFVFHASTIVIYKGWSQNRNQRIISKCPLHYSFTDRNRFDMPLFATLPGIPLVRGNTFVLTSFQLTVSFCNPNGRCEDIPLDRTFPRNIFPTISVGSPETSKRKNCIIIIGIRMKVYAFLNSPHYSPLIPCFSPFFTCHSLSPPTARDTPPPYSISDGFISFIRPPGMKRQIHHQPPPCKQRPPGSIESIFTYTGCLFPPSLLLLCFRFRY